MTGYDPADTGWFHGGDLKGLTGDCTGTRTGLARVKELGFTAIWVTPPYGQKTVQGDSAAYHGYWGLRLHVGRSASAPTPTSRPSPPARARTRAQGLPRRRRQPHRGHRHADRLGASSAPTRCSYRDCHGRTFDPARYAGGKTFPCLKATNMPACPSSSTPTGMRSVPAWLNDVRRYHNRGDINSRRAARRASSRATSTASTTSSPSTRPSSRGWREVYGDWIRRYKVDGFRVDTARHVDQRVLPRWAPMIRRRRPRRGVPDFELFGEV